ncbi:MAG: heparinase II/III family protein [Clostridia bacterium]|nr:heparinase II/III family protein [Clostridia bacterium]
MRVLEQKRTANGQVFPSPRVRETMYETPPVFTWLKERGFGAWRVAVENDAGEVWKTDTQKNYAVPEMILPPGNYRWNVYGLSAEGEPEAERGWQEFSIAQDAVEFLRPDAKQLFESVPSARPRHLFFAQDTEGIAASRPLALETLRRNIVLALKDGLPQPPMFHTDPNALPYREYFGRHRDFCDRNLVACALGHALLGDRQAGEHAKRLLLTMCDWNSEGPCSLEGPWGDEIGLSHARCFPAVFDLLYDILSEKERVFVARVIATYARQCDRRLRGIDFCANPGNSHAGRLPAYLGEAAMALKGTGVADEAELLRWLEYAIEIYGGIFPYFGGPDGGWAEGMFYAGSYTKWYLPFFSAVRRFSGADFLCRPFYRRLIRYFQHFCPPGWENHPFGDGYWCGPDDAEWPGFFAQNPYHVYAERFGGELMKQWSRDAQRQQVFKLHLLDAFLPDSGEAETEEPVTRACAFPDAGYISLHTDPQRPESEIALLARCSRYGSQSHSHADQGSFALLCGGTTLISPSGYFGRQYGTKHHMEWTNSTRAHNTILVGGEGQAEFSAFATGRVIGAWDDGRALRAEIDPSGAYEHVEQWTRAFELDEDGLTVTDHIELDAEREIDWLLHSLSRPEITPVGMRLERNGIILEIEPQLGGLCRPGISDTFDVDINEGEPEQYHVQMPQQFHMRWTAPARKIHDIRVRFDIRRNER